MTFGADKVDLDVLKQELKVQETKDLTSSAPSFKEKEFEDLGYKEFEDCIVWNLRTAEASVGTAYAVISATTAGETELWKDEELATHIMKISGCCNSLVQDVKDGKAEGSEYPLLFQAQECLNSFAEEYKDSVKSDNTARKDWESQKEARKMESERNGNSEADLTKFQSMTEILTKYKRRGGVYI